MEHDPHVHSELEENKQDVNAEEDSSGVEDMDEEVSLNSLNLQNMLNNYKKAQSSKSIIEKRERLRTKV